MPHLFALLAPAGQHFLILSARYRAIQRGLKRIDQSVTLPGGGGDISLFRPQPDDFGFTAERRFVSGYRLRPKKHVRATGLNIEVARSVIGQVDR